MRESSLFVRNNASEERKAQGTRPSQAWLADSLASGRRYIGIPLRDKC
jgi:hypothetical protein